MRGVMSRRRIQRSLPCLVVGLSALLGAPALARAQAQAPEPSPPNPSPPETEASVPAAAAPAPAAPTVIEALPEDAPSGETVAPVAAGPAAAAPAAAIAAAPAAPEPVPDPDAVIPVTLAAGSAPGVGQDSTAAPAPPETQPQPGVQLRVQGGVVWRSLSFDQDVYDRLRTLESSMLVYKFDAAVYPTFGWLPLQGNIGFIASYEGTLTGSVQDQNFDDSYPIKHSELYGGLRLRRPVAQHLLGFDLTVGNLRSGLDDGKSNASGIPDISYTEIRAAIDFTLQLERLRALAALGFRVPLGYGEVGEDEWFPHMGGYGFEAALRGSYALSPLVSLEAAGSLRRYVLEMNSQPEDPSEGRAEVAAGAVDAYWAAYVGVNFTL